MTMHPMQFEHRVTIRVAFAARRRELFANWLLAQSIQSANMAMWAQRLEETNDAEVAFSSLMEVL